MGQFHSSQASSGASEQPNQKTDYYELLGITRGATDEEIKKAYRKKALVLHPDRNYGNVDEATKLFAEIQSAYEVLADPQERAWYDSHSDAFLGTNANTDDQHSYNVRITTAQDVLKLFSKFSPRMEFSDSPTGFFGGLREQFEQLALEERLACQWENQDPIEYPSFGSSNDGFENVVRPFYAAWTGFSTQKTFAWKDAHRYSEAPDRRVRRMMEKENKRLREEGIREFNDAVRSLVAFVKKRDPRYKVNAQSEAQRQETLRQSVAAQAARSRAVNQAKMRDHVLPEWAQSEQPVAADDQEESEESEVESFECVVCHKYFKSQKQFEAHERSKKHLKAVKQLCWEMRMQNDELDLESADDSSANATTTKPLEVDDGEDEVYATSQVDVGLEASKSHDIDAEDQGGSHGPEETTKLSEPNSPTTSHDDDYASREYVETRLRTEMDSLSTGAGDSDIPDHPLSSDLTEQSPTLKMGKAKQKRAKKAAKQADQPGFICANCQAPFTSKSKLFNHIRDLGHAQPVTGSVARKGKKH
ncbi:Heat shock protein DnaJ [Penicillium cf. griseofulvum]|uniref:Heat shock protein DnaJ n=1 Tax=Penicillium cf. griseofulvum TaxID=2972120 RepID=A0A9W9T5I0_9EURO|nr:Heat shock protein DnaJ [Penicillium cf. griseofulvum]KAJ5424891.1 Heat shock protein DnaJ [Penicillium cf. griseofulvum]